MSDGHPSKARIYRLKDPPASKAHDAPKPQPEGAPIHVQFNPTSLRIQRTNDTSSGATTRAQRRQQPNSGHATLSLDLEFDTAEGGPTGDELDVRDLTKELRQFVEPPSGKPKKAPPRMRLEWGALQFDGIVSSLTEEIDYFSSEGMALRAKVSLSITGQDLLLEATESPADAAAGLDDRGRRRPGQRSGGQP